MPQSPIYPNAPLVEAVFEIRFPGEPAVECHRDLFFDRVRADYPTVWVPNIQPGQAPSIRPHHFKSDDGLCSVMTAINIFGFSTKRYYGFEEFKEECLKLIHIFVDLFKIGKLNRTGLRYINAIRFVQPKTDSLPFSDYLNLKLGLPEAFPNDLKNLEMAFVSNVSGGSITTRIGRVVAKDRSGEAILLDFDFAKEDDLHIEHVAKYLDESHGHTKNFFESILTPTYLSYVRGDAL